MKPITPPSKYSTDVEVARFLLHSYTPENFTWHILYDTLVEGGVYGDTHERGHVIFNIIMSAYATTYEFNVSPVAFFCRAIISGETLSDEEDPNDIEDWVSRRYMTTADDAQRQGYTIHDELKQELISIFTPGFEFEYMKRGGDLITRSL